MKKRTPEELLDVALDALSLVGLVDDHITRHVRRVDPLPDHEHLRLSQWLQRHADRDRTRAQKLTERALAAKPALRQSTIDWLVLDGQPPCWMFREDVLRLRKWVGRLPDGEPDLRRDDGEPA